MKPIRIFISSVQTEFAVERRALRDYLRNDPLMRRFFEPFLFEERGVVAIKDMGEMQTWFLPGRRSVPSK